MKLLVISMTRETIYIFCKDDGDKSYLTKKETTFVDSIIENPIKYPDPILSIEIIKIHA